MPILGSHDDQEHKRLLYGEGDMPTQSEDLLHYLSGEFQKGEPLRITSRNCDRVGRQLTDREVSRLEVLSAIQQLRYRQRRVVELLYVESVRPEDAADQLGISIRTLYTERTEALQAMADVIYEWRN